MALVIRSFVFALLCVVLFTGCSGLQKEHIQKRYFSLDISQGGTDKETATGKALLVKELLISPAFDSHAFTLKKGKNNFTTDYYNEFVSYPARLISDEITEELYRSSYFSQPLSDRKKSLDYRLSGKIIHLYGDIQTLSSPKAMIEIRLILEKKEASKFTPVLNKTYRADIPVAKLEPDQFISGWNTGLKKIMSDFMTDFTALKP